MWIVHKNTVPAQKQRARSVYLRNQSGANIQQYAVVAAIAFQCIVSMFLQYGMDGLPPIQLSKTSPFRGIQSNIFPPFAPGCMTLTNG